MILKLVISKNKAMFYLMGHDTFLSISNIFYLLDKSNSRWLKEIVLNNLGAKLIQLVILLSMKKAQYFRLSVILLYTVSLMLLTSGYYTRG